MKIKSPLLVLLSSLALAAAARAGDWTTNLYVSADAGAIFQQDADLHQSGLPTYSAAFNPGVRADLALGYNVCPDFAVELVPGFMWNSVDKLNGFSLDGSGESIDLYSVPLLANFVFKYSNQSRWTPYAGLGVGANVGFFDGTTPGARFNETDVSLAYQAEAGVKYALAPHAAIGLAYKFYGTTDQDYDLTANHYTDHLSFSGVYIHGVFLNFTLNF